ncbi:MAG: hypothetical protein JWQ30_161, partial [Sediminibacterium sp.]|nr:hypothetical protein [Sediminibacterium sp.]
INGYYPVKNAVIRDNIFLDCDPPFIRIGAFSPKREGMSIAPDTVSIANNIFASFGNASGEVLEIITPASHFTASGNQFSKGYTIKEKQGFTEMPKSGEKIIGQFDKRAVLVSVWPGADNVPPAITNRIGGNKNTYLAANEVGPVWLR